MRKILSYYHPSFSQENVKGSSNYKIIKSGRSLDLAYQLGAMTRRDCHVASLLTMTAILFSFSAHTMFGIHTLQIVILTGLQNTLLVV